jgi:hypothetical protein
VEETLHERRRRPGFLFVVEHDGGVVQGMFSSLNLLVLVQPHHVENVILRVLGLRNIRYLVYSGLLLESVEHEVGPTTIAD